MLGTRMVPREEDNDNPCVDLLPPQHQKHVLISTYHCIYTFKNYRLLGHPLDSINMDESKIYIPIWLKRDKLSSLKAKFDVSECRKGRCVEINEKSDGFFSPILDPGEGKYLELVGATVEFLKDDDGESWIGDLDTGRFRLKHMVDLQ